MRSILRGECSSMVERFSVEEVVVGSTPTTHPNLEFGNDSPLIPLVLSGFSPVLTWRGEPAPRERGFPPVLMVYAGQH